MRKMPRREREIIGAVTVIGGIIILWLMTDGEESLELLGSVPLMTLFIWLCPELWQGK